MRTFCSAAGAFLVAWLGSQTAENLVFNGDFEAAGPGPDGPPPGWAMWGAARYKDPANFTRDTTNPHGGRACFRIRHPAGTGGYAVSSPEHPLRTERGAMFEVRFWARAEPPGESSFGFDGYESLRPFVEAPSPGFRALAVGPDWREFRFEIHEGWDFFADRTRFLLLVFKVASGDREERTLWIDDVEVRRRPSPRQGRLTDLRSLEARLDHALNPGGRLEVVVDASRRVRPACRKAGGVSFHRVAGWTRGPYSREGEYTLHPELEEAIRDLRLPMTRFYGVGDEPFGLEGALDRVAMLMDRLGIPQEQVVLELETQGATSRIPPADWARGVRHSLGRGYRFRHWEVSNEPYLGRPGQVFRTPDEYAEHFLAVSAAVRGVQPGARIGLPVNPGNPSWCSYLLQKASGHYDFVVGHHYCFANPYRTAPEDVVLTANYGILTDLLRLNALVRASGASREAVQRDTEWGMHGGGPAGERPDDAFRNGNIVGALHRVVRLIYYAREGILEGASAWEMFTRLRSPGFGLLSPEAPGKRSMLYWLHWLFNRHVGEHVLGLEGTSPWHTGRFGGEEIGGPAVPVLATGTGEEVFVVAANGSREAVPASFRFRGCVPERVEGWLFTHGDLDAHPFVDRREEVVRPLSTDLAPGAPVSFTLPPRSAAFLGLRGR